MGLVVVLDDAPKSVGVQGIFEFPKGVTVQILAYRSRLSASFTMEGSNSARTNWP
jgi:hypothetical protein